jgi:Uma2 family endonuclease
MSPLAPTDSVETLADLLERLGGISPGRVVLKPAPGKAAEKDLLRLLGRTDRLYELVEGTLVEKVMGYGEGCLAADIIRLLGKFLDQHDLGDVGGADATMRLMPGLVRIPDVSFVRWEKLPNRERPAEPIPGLVPDLAIEVLSEGNTPGEMKRKLKEYFLAGVSIVWFVEPRERTVEVFTAPDRSTTLTEEQALDGGDVLRGLRLPVREVFARVPRQKARGQGKPTSTHKRRRRGRRETAD